MEKANSGATEKLLVSGPRGETVTVDLKYTIPTPLAADTRVKQLKRILSKRKTARLAARKFCVEAMTKPARLQPDDVFELVGTLHIPQFAARALKVPTGPKGSLRDAAQIRGYFDSALKKVGM